MLWCGLAAAPTSPLRSTPAGPQRSIQRYGLQRAAEFTVKEAAALPRRDWWRLGYTDTASGHRDARTSRSPLQRAVTECGYGVLRRLAHPLRKRPSRDGR